MRKLVRTCVFAISMLLTSLGVWVGLEANSSWDAASRSIEASAIGKRLAAGEFDEALNAAERVIGEAYFGTAPFDRPWGCSTISGLFSSRAMQAIPASYVANAVLTEAWRSSTMDRHVAKALVACRLERKFDHPQLVKAWLSAAYFGGGHIGIDAAAASLFGKPPAALTQDEALKLAVLLRVPVLWEQPATLDKQVERFRRRLEEQPGSR